MVRPGTTRHLSRAAFTAVLLAGCSPNPPITAIHAAAGVNGAIHGGQQPISGATIQLYAVGTTGDGSASTALLPPGVTSDANGNFNVTNLYTCPTASSLVYITGTGGSPAPSIANSQIALMAVLGTCGSIGASTFVDINELTSVAAVYSLVPYISSFSAIGSGSSDAAAFAQNFTAAGELVNTSTGTAPGTGLPPGYTVPVAQVNTIGDLVAACINSPGGVSGDTSLCGQFFALPLPSGGTVPTDTVGALLNLAKNPALNTSALYNLIPPSSPFQPTDPIAPPDFAVRLLVNSLFTVSPPSLAFAQTTLGFTQTSQAVTVTNGTAATINISLAGIGGVNASDFISDFQTSPAPPNACTYQLAANSTCTIDVSFAPTATGARAAYLIVSNNSANPSIAVALSGRGALGSNAGPIALTPATLSFDRSNNPQTATLTNNGSTVLHIGGYQFGASVYYSLPSVTCGSTLAPSTSCTITIAPNLLLTPTPTNTFTVIDDAATGPQTINLAYNAGSLTYPPAVDFGHWALGVNGSESIQILNGPGTSGSFNFTLTGPNAADFTGPASCTYAYRQNQQCAVNLTFHRTTLGTSTAYLNISGFGTSFGSITLTGTADPAGLDFDIFFPPYPGTPYNTLYGAPVRAVDFGTISIGSSATFSNYLIKNTGSTSSVTLNPAVITGPNASDFSVSPSTGIITFTPTASGPRSATLTDTDTTNTATRAIALTGTGN